MDFAPEEDFYSSSKSSTPQFFRLLSQVSTRIHKNTFEFKLINVNLLNLLFWKSQRYQSLLDASTPHVIGRWIFAISLLIFFMFRVVLNEVSVIA